MMRQITLLLAPAALLLAAESGRLDGPVPALVFDTQAHAVRPMIGIPGSAYLGAALANDVDSAVGSPDGKSMAFLKGGSLHVLSGGSTRIIAEGIEGTFGWSADSTTLAAGGRLFHIADGSATQLRALDGSTTALAAASGHAVAANSEGVVLLTQDSARLLASADKVVSLALQGKDLYFADRSRGEVWLLRDYANGGDPVLVSKLESVAGVDAIGDRILIAAGRKVLALRVGSFEPVFEIDLDFDASSLSRLNRSTWLLNAGQPGALQVLSLDGSPAVYFIPRGEEAN